VRGLALAIASGERIFLRHPLATDRDEWIELREASWEHLRPWEPTPPDHDRVSNNHADAFERILETAQRATSQRFLICAVTSGEILGQISLNQIFRGSFCSASTGYWIGQRHARQGFMTEALRTLLAHAFGPLLLHRVEANIIPGNIASRGVAIRVGMRLEGLSPRFLRINGAWQDHERWAITAEELGSLEAIRRRVADTPEPSGGPRPGAGSRPDKRGHGVKPAKRRSKT
jgi:ribosomal-protein-alanine N-acetyltransferase